MADELFQPAFEGRAFEEDAAFTGEASQADIGSQAGDLPVRAAAGVRTLQPHHVIEVKLEGRDYTPAGKLGSSR